MSWIIFISPHEDLYIALKSLTFFFSATATTVPIMLKVKR